MTSRERHAAARRAYELGRVGRGLRAAWLLPPVIGLAALIGPHPGWALGAGVGLAVLWMLLWWRSTSLGEAAVAGLLAGLPPLILPLLVGNSGHTCAACSDGSRWPLCMAACIAGGLLAGALVGIPAARRPRHRLRFLAVGMLFTGVVGSLGCTMAGGIGVAGMLLGFVAGSAPALVFARAAVR